MNKFATVLFILMAALFAEGAYADRTPSNLEGRLSATAPAGGFLLIDDPPRDSISIALDRDAFAEYTADYSLSRSGPNDLFMTGEYNAKAEVFGGLSPTVTAETSTSITTTDPSQTLSFGARARSILNYEVVVAERKTPPLPNTFIPTLRLFVDAIAEARLEGHDNGIATARVDVWNTSITFKENIDLDVRAERGGDAEAVTERGVIRAKPGHTFRVNLFADAVSVTSGEVDVEGAPFQPLIEESSAFAIADPRFTFDQASFDADMADMGLDTFDLNEYYTLVYSEGIIPEPGGLAIWLGMLALIGKRLRRPVSVCPRR